MSVIDAPINSLTAPEMVDVVWTSQNYHDLHDSFAKPADLAIINKAVFAALKPGGLYVILDHAAAPGSGLRDTETLHRIDEASVKQEVLAAGFKLVRREQRSAQSEGSARQACVRSVDPSSHRPVHLEVHETTSLRTK